MMLQMIEIMDMVNLVGGNKEAKEYMKRYPIGYIVNSWKQE